GAGMRNLNSCLERHNRPSPQVTRGPPVLAHGVSSRTVRTTAPHRDGRPGQTAHRTRRTSARGDPELLSRQDGVVVRPSVEVHDALDHEAGIGGRIDVGGYLPEGPAGVDYNGLTGGRRSTAFPSAGVGSGAHGHPEKDER